MQRTNLRNIAIIAHVDHGKTTLVDAMLKATHTVKDEQANLVMDSMDLERERGITIKAKNASMEWEGHKINIVDTPGHADFGGEVERTLKMADGVILLVDAKEGPMPQTKFVLKKALGLGHKAIVVINKVDKPGANIDEALNKTFDLFVKLNASHLQLDFPIIYASGIRGLASESAEELLLKVSDQNTPPDLTPLFNAILKHIPAPSVESDKSFGMQVLALMSDNYKGRMGIGKIVSGKIKKSENIILVKPDGTKQNGKVSALSMYQGLKQIDAEQAEAGDIVAIAGFDDIHIGDILTDPQNPISLPAVEIEPPTIKMTFGVNTSPFAGREGKFVTSRNLRERLVKELETNVALKVETMDGTPITKEASGGGESFLVSGRGELHLGILIETMRREGFELQVSQPQVIFHEQDGVKHEPYEICTVDVPSEYQGVVIEELGRRGGELQHMDTSPSGELHAEYLIPTRGLIGLKNLLLTRTRGTAVVNNLFDSYKPVHQIDERTSEHGSLISSESGVSNAYGLNNAQERGIMFIGPAVEVYEGMVVGQNALDSDIELNVCKTKKLTNMRSSGADDAIILTPPRPITLDFAMEYIGPDELLEVTPLNIRIRKKILSATERKRSKR
ncbi:MAG: translational GTPase TypA [Candidatus Doudnabacteria bacterium]|nr:translational GTPase TypA [Candidatus Doudnabacteria bacterium]